MYTPATLHGCAPAILCVCANRLPACMRACWPVCMPAGLRRSSVPSNVVGTIKSTSRQYSTSAPSDIRPVQPPFDQTLDCEAVYVHTLKPHGCAGMVARRMGGTAGRQGRGRAGCRIMGCWAAHCCTARCVELCIGWICAAMHEHECDLAGILTRSHCSLDVSGYHSACRFQQPFLQPFI